MGGKPHLKRKKKGLVRVRLSRPGTGFYRVVEPVSLLTNPDQSGNRVNPLDQTGFNNSTHKNEQILGQMGSGLPFPCKLTLLATAQSHFIFFKPKNIFKSFTHLIIFSNDFKKTYSRIETQKKEEKEMRICTRPLPLNFLKIIVRQRG